MDVRSAIFQAAALTLSGLVLLALSPASAAAAESTSYELPDATHAGPLAIARDGTAWFVPSRGSDWDGRDYAIVGNVAADGTVSERRVAGFSIVSGIAASPGGAIWVSGFRGSYEHKLFQIGRLSSAGELLRRYPVGRGQGSIRSMSVSAGAVWLIRQGFSPRRFFTRIERIAIASGKLRHFSLPPDCHASALAVAPDGTPWFLQKCGGFRGEGTASRTSIIRIEAGGKLVRRRIAPQDYPVALAVGQDGTVWFGSWRYYQPSRIGRLTPTGKLAEFPIPKGSPYSIAVGSEGRLWFASSLRGYFRGVTSIGTGGQLGDPVCADPTCTLEPNDLTRGPDGTIWYGLRAPNYNTGGGSSGIFIEEQIGNEAGFLGRLGR
ncbi:MAG TPA: hypothetical protein VEB65_00740 [Solirubrobacterales bacterium]|nr:hypothetical protein [Solirubrobacterales bacterium]